MFFKLAIHNVRRSLRDYAIYFLTLTFGVCLFYVFNHFYFLYFGLFSRLLQSFLNEATQKRIGYLHAVRYG